MEHVFLEYLEIFRKWGNDFYELVDGHLPFVLCLCGP